MSLDPITAALDLVKLGAEKLWPDANKRGEQLQKLEELKQAGRLAELNAELALLTGQMEVNKAEAASTSIFVSGWRPFVGWICGFALAYVAIIEPFARIIAKLSGYDGEFPVIDTTITLQVLVGMLGLATQRTHEKVKGVATK